MGKKEGKVRGGVKEGEGPAARGVVTTKSACLTDGAVVCRRKVIICYQYCIYLSHFNSFYSFLRCFYVQLLLRVADKVTQPTSGLTCVIQSASLTVEHVRTRTTRKRCS